MTAARSARRQAVLAARADATVRGPILSSLPCGCCVDADGGLWEPCSWMAHNHARAVRLARSGMGRSIQLSAILTTIDAHVAQQRQHAARMAAEQGSLL